MKGNRHSWFGGLGSMVKLMVLASILGTALDAAGQAVQYSLVPIGLLPDTTRGYAYGVNDAGQVVGMYEVDSDTSSHAVLFANGTLTDLGAFGGAGAEADAINDSGVIVGTYVFPANASDDHAFAYTASGMIDLGLPAGFSQGGADAINASGVAVGWAGTTAGAGDFVACEFLNGQAIVLQAPQPSGTSWAFGINDTGEVVGVNLPVAGVIDACVWINGIPQDLGTFGYQTAQANGVNNSGQIAVWVGTGEESRALLLTNGLATDLGDLGVPNVGPGSHRCVNAAGEVVGQAAVPSGGTHGFLYRGGVMLDLNNLADSTAAGWVIEFADSISDNGYIAATGTYQGVQQGMLLVPHYTLVPSGFSVFRGILRSGALTSLDAIDGDELVVGPGPTLSPGEAPVSVVVTGTSNLAAPGELKVALTAKVNTVGLAETVELWDYAAAKWVTVADQGATTSETTLVATATNGADCVEPGTGAIKARVSWKRVAPTSTANWQVSIDQVAWIATP